MNGRTISIILQQNHWTSEPFRLIDNLRNHVALKAMSYISIDPMIDFMTIKYLNANVLIMYSKNEYRISYAYKDSKSRKKIS